jgi:hypothetical protein
MSDYRNFKDPMGRDVRYDPDMRGGGRASWGWIAAAVVVLIVLAVAFSTGHGPNRTASNDLAPPPASRMAPSIDRPSPANPGNPAPQGGYLQH